MKSYALKFCGFILLFVFLNGCKSDEISSDDFKVTIRLRSDPGKMNPMVGNPTTESTEINSPVFLPLAQYDPETYELSPVLIKALSEGDRITEGQYSGGIAYEYEILEDAEWEDGTPITAADYLFTLKVVKNPNVDAAAWRGLLSQIVNVEISETNPKKFIVTVGEFFHLAREITCTFEIFPKHIYDSEGRLDDYPLSLLNNQEQLASEMESDSTLGDFANQFNSPEYTINTISGAGPYRLKSYEVDQYIVLEAKEDYWGSNYPERLLLQSGPSEVTYRFIADENTAATLLKDGSIDLLKVNDASAFENLTQSENFDSLFTIHTPPLARYYYIGMNSRTPEFEDKDVRRAMAHLFDVENIIETLENGYGERQIGTIMARSEYYDNDMEPIPFNIDKANQILEEEGWIDSNGNGIRDKLVDGQLVELEIDYMASQSPLGQNVGLLFQETARQAGVEVNMVIKEGRQLNQSLYNHDFEMSTSASGLSLAPYDPYQRWHSDNSVLEKGNVFGYVNERNDELIEAIRNTEDLEKRKDLYEEFQELMYDEQPVVFLYSPVQKFVLSKKFNGFFSRQRPGYFINGFELAK